MNCFRHSVATRVLPVPRSPVSISPMPRRQVLGVLDVLHDLLDDLVVVQVIPGQGLVGHARSRRPGSACAAAAAPRSRTGSPALPAVGALLVARRAVARRGSGPVRGGGVEPVGLLVVEVAEPDVESASELRTGGLAASCGTMASPYRRWSCISRCIMSVHHLRPLEKLTNLTG